MTIEEFLDDKIGPGFGNEPEDTPKIRIALRPFARAVAEFVVGEAKKDADSAGIGRLEATAKRLGLSANEAGR